MLSLAVGAEEGEVLYLRVLRKLRQKAEDRPVGRRRLEVEDEAELEVDAWDRARLELCEVDVYRDPGLCGSDSIIDILFASGYISSPFEMQMNRV